MARFSKEKHTLWEQVPGKLVFIGEKKVGNTTIRLNNYDQEQLSIDIMVTT